MPQWLACILKSQIMNNQELVKEITIAEPAISISPSWSPRVLLLGEIVSTPQTRQANQLVAPTSAMTPAFHRKARVSSGSSVDSPLDPFTSAES